jgi:hypothetical protein
MRKIFFKRSIGGLLLIGSIALLGVNASSTASAVGAAKKVAPKPKPKPKTTPAKPSTKATVPPKPADLALPIGTAGTFHQYDVNWSVRFLSGITPMTGRWVGTPLKSEPGEQWYSLLTEIGNLGGKTETFEILQLAFSVDGNQGETNAGLKFEDNVDGIPNCKESSNLLNLSPGQKVQCHLVINIKDTELANYFASYYSYDDKKLVVFRIR